MTDVHIGGLDKGCCRVTEKNGATIAESIAVKVYERNQFSIPYRRSKKAIIRERPLSIFIGIMWTRQRQRQRLVVGHSIRRESISGDQRNWA